MTDIVSKAVRSRMMSGIKGKNTKPELFLRSNLHRLGFRFRLHHRGLPGRPDLVFSKHRAVLFVHGCFWHGHDCHLFRWPASHKIFWRKKILRNRKLDRQAIAKLTKMGWRVGIVWECAIKGKRKLAADRILGRCSRWLLSKSRTLEIRGQD